MSYINRLLLQADGFVHKYVKEEKAKSIEKIDCARSTNNGVVPLKLVLNSGRNIIIETVHVVLC